MFLSKSSLTTAAVALLLSSATTTVAQTDGTLPNCTEAEVNETSAIIGTILGGLSACGGAAGAAKSLAEAQAACTSATCVNAFKYMLVYDLPATECVQYIPQNPSNVSNTQQIRMQAINGGTGGLENACINAVQGKSSCRGGTHHPDIFNRDLELLGESCYSALSANNMTGCFNSNCSELMTYVSDSQWPTGSCSFGYFSPIMGSTMALNGSCLAVKAGECSSAQLTSFATVAAEYKAANADACADDHWIMKALNETDGANCTYMGAPVSMSDWSAMNSAEICSMKCSEEQLEEFTMMTSTLLGGNYTTCVAELAASPETACSTSEVCKGVFASLANVTAPDCEIDGVPAKDLNMTTGITEALAALDAACDAMSPASTMLPGSAVAGLLVTMVMALF